MLGRQPPPLPVILGAAGLGAAALWLGRSRDQDRGAEIDPFAPPIAAMTLAAPRTPPPPLA